MEAPGSHLVNPGRPAAAGRMGAWFRRSWFLFIAWPWLAIAQESNAPVVERPTPTHQPEAVSPRAARFKPSRSSAGEIVALGHDVVVKEGETVRTVVVLGGSASVDGRISDDLVVLMGNVRLGPNAEVREHARARNRS